MIVETNDVKTEKPHVLKLCLYIGTVFCVYNYVIVYVTLPLDNCPTTFYLVPSPWTTCSKLHVFLLLLLFDIMIGFVLIINICL